MTDPHDEARSASLDGMAAAQASVTLLDRLAERLGGRASTRTVFGEPVVSERVVVIPVARVRFGFGGGAGRDGDRSQTVDGGGGGGGADVRPLGFIEIRDDSATYKSLRGPWADVLAPLAAVLTATVVPKFVRAFTKRRRRCCPVAR